MNRYWLLGGLVILAGAGVVGWLNAGAQVQLVDALILADTTTPGCDGAGQVHLLIRNAAERPMARVDGVLSVASQDAQPTPIGNFEVTGPISAGGSKEACATVDESLLPPGDRVTLLVLARATAIEFAPASP